MRVIVIDDQEWRVPYYKGLKTKAGLHFELSFFNESQVNGEDLNSISNYDLVLLDVVLNGLNSDWELSSFEVAERIRAVSKNIPIVLVTGNWSDLNNYQIEQLSKYFDTHPVPLSFYDLLTKNQIKSLIRQGLLKPSFEGVNSTNITKFGRALKSILATKSKQVFLDKCENKSLYMLHLSDMQVGGNTVKANNLEPYGIAQYIKYNYQVPDFIAITGDFTETGHPDEFCKAYEWISAMCKQFDWSYPYKRLLLVPGNHDVFAPAFGVCTTEYLRTNSDGDLQRGFSQISDIRNLSIASGYSLRNFQEFAYKLTNNPYWVNNSTCSWVDNNYRSNGLSLWGFNTIVGHTYNSPFSGLPDETYYESFRKRLVDQGVSDDSMVIALGHHPSLAYNPIYVEFAQTPPRPHILLSGHLHEPKQTYFEDAGLLSFVAPTSSLGALSRVEGAHRGFSIIELKRKNRVITGVVHNSHIRVGNKWSKFDDSSKEYIYESSQWRLV